MAQDVRTKETLRLVQAFEAINDRPTRRSLLTLTEKLAGLPAAKRKSTPPAKRRTN